MELWNRLVKVAEIIQKQLPPAYRAEACQSVVDMPIDPDHVRITLGRGMLGSVVAKFRYNDKTGKLEHYLGEPIDSIIKTVENMKI